MSRDVANSDAVAYAATPARRLADELARWSSYAMAILLLASVAVLWCRHLAAALRQPLDGPTLLLAGAFAAGTGAAARMCFRWTAPTGVAFEWFVSFCLLAWGIAVSSIAAYADGLALFWTILAGEELWAWWSVTGLARRLRSFQAARGAMNDREPAPQTSEVPGASDALVGKHALSPQVVCEADVLQEFVRSRQPGGAEQLSGWMRVSLSPGQRTAVVHLAFCPPFARTPAVTVVQHEGPAARIKAVQVLPFGARMDLKLAQAPPSNADVLLEIAVHADGTEG